MKRSDDRVERFFVEYGTYARPTMRQTNGELVEQGQPYVVLGHDIGDEHDIDTQRLLAMPPKDAFQYAQQILAACVELGRGQEHRRESGSLTAPAPPMPPNPVDSSPRLPEANDEPQRPMLKSGGRVRIRTTGEEGSIKSVGPGHAIVIHADGMMVRRHLDELEPIE